MSQTENTKVANILLAEDEQADIELVQSVLTESKILNHFSFVKDGVSALKFLYQEDEYKEAPRPDLILLDLNMPKKNGIEVLKEVKSDPKLRRIPVVVMTSSNAEEDIVKSYDLHANCYIRKPLNLGEFQKIIHALEDFWFSIVTVPSK